ncbi:dipeptide/oligopeptide/nickel ABC transporter permease/ATP-binding protein [Rhodococcus spelaei]|uniref:Dipeptide/oligopeptide/nickel ABC transporter permease/ATP-binding protein n=1 Tax=Rhodococcus spelaei TaxID=2546320 RepID=A0A541BM82_9NOCA|nr:dipeptide/oligopeptide/nickel ABC transporter permease/ATP-binding protein [Rhodococcus spelaei]TQF73442.1 dipeptide/oligopeptide/nickel ABC transporter permease/ATP-binding protein [Rhodococcus spelaei]
MSTTTRAGLASRCGAVLRRDRLVGPAVALLVAVVAVSVAAPWLSVHDPTAVDFVQALLPPSAENPLGTDNFGRDVLTRLMYGGRASLAAAAVAVLVIVTVGSVLGGLAGYLGGVVDLAITRMIDVLLAFPRLVLAIAIAALLGTGLAGLIIAMSVVSWPAYARIVRGLVLQAKEEGYVVAARAAGSGRVKVLRTHISGAVVGPVLVVAMVDFGEVILGVAALSFLGLGIQQPTPEWGAMLNEARGYLEEAPWVFLAPGLTIFLVVICANYVGDAVRDAIDPRAAHQLSPRRFRDRWRSRRGTVRRSKERARRMRLEERASACRDRTDVMPPIVVDVRALGVEVIEGAPVIADLSLRIRAGECVGLVGESGSGKSTLAAALLGLVHAPLRVSAGTVSLLGEDVTGWSWDDWRPVRGRHVSLITQDPMSALNPLLRIGAQLDECGTAHGLSGRDARDRSIETLALMRLPVDVLGQFPHQLSGGMRQRVVIAMALVNRPQLVIADEPTTALDVSTQARILEELTALRTELGIGMLFISHDLRLVANLADRVVVMHDGRVVEEGVTAELFDNPRADHTRLLIDAIPRIEHPKERHDALC